MTMIYVQAKIEGVTPLLQHRYTESAASETSKTTRKVKVESELSPREIAEQCAYRHGDGFLYLPCEAITTGLRDAGTGYKMKGSRKSVKYVVPAAVTVDEPFIPLKALDGSLLEDYEVDSRRVVIRSTKGAVVRHRPRLDKWSADVPLTIDIDVLPEDIIQKLLADLGSRIGVGDFRPATGGPYGRFRVTCWERVEMHPHGHERAAE